MPRTIAIANQKGGVGKTTTAMNVAAILAAAEFRTLLIDLDPQANATSGLGIYDRSDHVSLYAVLLDGAPLGSAVRRGVHLQHLDVLAGTQGLAGAELELVRLPDPLVRLREALAPVHDLYDFVLLDCPPSMGLLTLNALAAAGSVLIPMQAEYFALEGLSQIINMIEMVREELNPRLRIEGLLLTMFDRRLNLAREVEEEVRRVSGQRVFRTMIPRNVALAEAPSFGKPVITYSILSPGAQAYLALVRELVPGLDQLTPRGERQRLSLAVA
jgi:chromosome partitioning protein